jgi:hypothetical protein
MGLKGIGQRIRFNLKAAGSFRTRRFVIEAQWFIIS